MKNQWGANAINHAPSRAFPGRRLLCCSARAYQEVLHNLVIHTGYRGHRCQCHRRLGPERSRYTTKRACGSIDHGRKAAHGIGGREEVLCHDPTLPAVGIIRCTLHPVSLPMIFSYRSLWWRRVLAPGESRWSEAVSVVPATKSDQGRCRFARSRALRLDGPWQRSPTTLHYHSQRETPGKSRQGLFNRPSSQDPNISPTLPQLPPRPTRP